MVDTLDSRQVGNTQAARQCTMQVLPQPNFYLKRRSAQIWSLSADLLVKLHLADGHHPYWVMLLAAASCPLS